MVDIGEFLEMTRFKVLHHEDPCETALWHMFKQLNDEGFPNYWNSPEDFHKMFRQNDVFRNSKGHLDMVMYHLIEHSNVLWPLFCRFVEREKNHD